MLALAPVVLAAPVVALYGHFRAYSSATAQATYYPPLLSLLGKDFYAAWRAVPSLRTLASLLLVHLKIAQVLAAGLFAAGTALVLAGRLRTRQARFACAAALLFLWLAMDTSPAMLAPNLTVHWYRVFDFFLALFSLLAVLALGAIARRLARRLPAPVLPALFLALLAVRFVSWDPVAHEEYRDTSLARSLRSDPDAGRLASALGSLPAGSLILPEVLRVRGPHGSPHWLDYLIQSAGHRNALGLTIESSLTPLVTYAYLAQGMGQVFVWGIDPSWAQAVFAGLGPAAPQRVNALPRYLAAAGVGYIITQSDTARAYAQGMAGAFERVFSSGPLALFRVVAALPPVTALMQRPWGLVDLDALRGRRMSPGRLRREFLLHANWVQLNAGVEPIINLSPRPERIRELSSGIEGLIVVNTGADPAAYHSLPPHVRSGLPLILVNFVPDPSLPAAVRILPLPSQAGAGRGTGALREPAPLRYALSGSTIGGAAVKARGPAARLGGAPDSAPAEGQARAIEIRLSYSPQWRSARGSEIFQTGLNHMLVLTPGPGEGAELDLRLESPLSRVVTLAMALLIVAAAAAGPLGRLLPPVRRRPPFRGRRNVFTALRSRVGPPPKGRGDPGISVSGPPRATS